MEKDPGVRRQRERLKRLYRKLGVALEQAEESLDATSQSPTAGSLGQIDRLRVEIQTLLQDYLEQQANFLDSLRDHLRKIEEANRRSAMTEQRASPARDQARIQELSEQLSLELRLERVDRAIKELLDFLADADFFAANASTGRRRRLRALQNAIDKALQK